MTNNISINRNLVSGACLVRLTGIINEDFNQQSISQLPDNVIVFDLDNVQRITSFGVRQWVSALKDLNAEYYAFLNCRPAIVSQFNMVANFGGQGSILSLYAPYLCPNCDKEIEVLIDLRQKHADVVSGKVPKVTCPSCQGQADFDDIPSSYFSYLSTKPLPQIPPLAAKLIESIKDRFSIQKEISDRVTSVWLAGPLDNNAHFKRLTDGLEGFVVVICAGISDSTAEGLERFEKLTSATGVQVYLSRLPLSLAGMMSAQRFNLNAAKVVSLWVSFACQNCKKTFEVEADYHFFAKRAPGNFGESRCPHCQKSTTLQQVQHPQAWQILQQYRKSIVQAPEEVADYLKAHPGSILSEHLPIFPSSSGVIPAVDRTLVVNPPNQKNVTPHSTPNSPQSLRLASPGRRCPQCQAIYPGGINTCPKDGTATVDVFSEKAQIDPLIGKQAGNYRILALLGEGGMGRVYSAEHASLGKKVAVKVLHREYAQSATLVERFFEEARAASQIGHDHIVDVQDFGILEGFGVPFFVMEFLPGESLSDLLKREQKLPIEAASGIVLQLLDALSAAHKRGIIHRDLKPDNIFLLPKKNEKYFVKLLDFGVAKLLTENPGGGKALTQAGALVGTPRYMSPEQASGKSHQTDGRADLYSVGIIFYEMLCGRSPFLEVQFSELVLAHITTPPPPPRSIEPSITPAIENVILKSLEKQSKDRFVNAEEMARAVQSALTEPQSVSAKQEPAQLPSTNTPTTLSGLNGEMAPNKTRTRLKVAIALGVIGLISGVLGAMFFMNYPSGSSAKKTMIVLSLDSEPSSADVSLTIDGVTKKLDKSPTTTTVPYGVKIEAVFVKDGMSCSQHLIVTQDTKVSCKLLPQ